MGIIGIGVSGLLINPLTSFLIVNIGLLILLLSDYFISRKHIHLEVIRTGSDKLSVGEEERIYFDLYNKSDYGVEVELIDEVPDYHFKVRAAIMKCVLAPGEKEAISYEVIPKKRGAFKFGNIHIRVKGKLGFYYQYEKIPLEREYKVYPNLQTLKKYQMTMYKHLLEREERKVVRIRDKGTSFESLKEYVVGDDYRKMNWKASARLDKPIVNQYEPEKNQRVYAFVDSGRPMSYTLRGECKLDKAINTALILSDMVTRNGDLSGMMSFNTKIESYIMPGKGGKHRDRIMESLYHIESIHLTSNYEDAFLYFKGKERHKSIIFMFTDFDTYEEADLLAKAASVVENVHILVIVLIKNKDIEAMTLQRADTEEAIFNKAVAIDLLEERKKAIRRLNRKNMMCIEIEAEKIEFAVINKYIQIKNKLDI